MTNDSELRRTDDTFFRKLITSLILMVLLEGGSFIYYYGKLVDRVDHMEIDIIELQLMSKTITNMDRTLYVLNSKTDSLSTKLDRQGRMIEKIRASQNKSENIIRDAATHMKDRSTHRRK